MAVYAENIGRKKPGQWKAIAAESLAGFVLRFVALLIVAAALFAALSAANLTQPYWLAPVEENPILIPAPWSGESTI